MKMEIYNEERNEFTFNLSDKEVAEIIYSRLKPTNPCLTMDRIKRRGKAYICEFTNNEGFDVRIDVDISQLKRYLGSRTVGFNKNGNGVFVRRIISRNRLR